MINYYGLITAFSIVANHFSVEFLDATRYFVAQIVNTNMYYYMIDNNNPFEEYENAVEFARNTFGWEDTFEDELFTIKLNKVLETTKNYNVQMILDVDLSGNFSKISKSGTSLEDEIEKNDAILDAAQNAANKHEEALKEQEEQLNKVEASVAAYFLVGDLEKSLDISKASIQIDNKLYLKYSKTEKDNIYKLMTSNAQKIFEKNTNYFKKSGAYYYDTGKLRTLPILFYTDTYYSTLEASSVSEDMATFDVVIKWIVGEEEFGIKPNATYYTYKDGLKIVRKDGEWLIDSLKFKSTVEEDDTYPESIVIEKDEEKTENNQENNKTEETKKEENKKEETIQNEVVNTNKEENVNVKNNISNISNQTTNATTTEEQRSNVFKLEYGFYVVATFLIVILFIVYKLDNKKENDDNNLL